jgi:hypothetical protein
VPKRLLLLLLSSSSFCSPRSPLSVCTRQSQSGSAAFSNPIVHGDQSAFDAPTDKYQHARSIILEYKLCKS